MSGRLSAGLTLASLPLIAAIPAFQAGNMVLAWIFVALFGALSALTAAPRVPLLHRIPPPVGAARPPVVTFHLEGEDGMSFAIPPHSPTPDVAVILVVGMENDQRDEIPKVHLNAEVVGSTQIRRCQQDGQRYPGEGMMLRADGTPYWYDRLEVPPQHLVMYFQVDLPGPGSYPVVLKLWSSSFFRKGDHDYSSEVQILASSPDQT